MKISPVPDDEEQEDKCEEPEEDNEELARTGAALGKDESVTFPVKIPENNSVGWIRHMPRNWNICCMPFGVCPKMFFPGSWG